MAPFLRPSWRPTNSFLVKLNSVAGGVSSAAYVNKASDLSLEPRKAGLESESAGTPETQPPTQSSDATSTKQSTPATVTSKATTATSVKSDSAPDASTTVPQGPAETSVNDTQPSSTQNTSVVVPSASTGSSTGSKPTSAAAPSNTSTDEPTVVAPPPTPSTSSVSPTATAPPPPATASPSPTQAGPKPGSSSSSVPVPPVSNPDPAATVTGTPSISVIPTSAPAKPTTSGIGGPVVNPPAASSVSPVIVPPVGSSTSEGPIPTPSPSQVQDGGQVVPTISQVSSLVPPSGVTAISTGPAPEITPDPTSVAVRVGGQGTVVGGTTFTESSITRVITTTSASVVTSDGRTFTTDVTVKSTQVVPTRVPVPTAGTSALGDTNPQRTRALVGGIVGGAIIVLFLSILTWIFFRRRRQKQELKWLESATKFDPYSPAPLRSNVSSFVMPPPSTIRDRSPTPVMSEKPQSYRPGFVVTSARKKPPPFLEDPTLSVRQRADPFDAQSFDSDTTSSLNSINPVHVHPISAMDPFDDPSKPMPNPFDDPPEPASGSSNSKRNSRSSVEVPSLVVSPATPTVAEKRHSTTSSFRSDSSKSLASGEVRDSRLPIQLEDGR